MKLRVLFIALFAFVCAQAHAAAAKPRVIEVTANDQMKFSTVKIEAKAGEEIVIAFTNAGTQPKEVMGHNFVLLQPGTDPTAFGVAAASAKDTDYIPASMKDKVIGHTPVLGPRKSAEIPVKLEAGEYPFLCSFPGHFALMKGVLVVK